MAEEGSMQETVIEARKGDSYHLPIREMRAEDLEFHGSVARRGGA